MSSSNTQTEARCVWITGASSGLGEGLAKAYAKQGGSLVLSARSAEKLEQLAQQLRSEAKPEQRIDVVPFDVAREDAVEEVRGRLMAYAPELDTVILSAGVCEYMNFEEPDWQMLKRVMNVNFFGAAHAVEAVLPLLKENAKKGYSPHIVGIASQALLMPFTRAQAYGSSKAAVHYFFQSLRMDLSVYGIDVTSVLPGFVQTPMTQQNNFSMPFLMSVDKAVERIFNAIQKRPATYVFPKRLHAILRMFSLFPQLWFNKMRPRSKEQLS